MSTTARLALGAGALLAFSTVGALVPAQAATQHCDAGLGKMEVGAGPRYQTSLPEGTPVCIKAGTQTYMTTVGGDGWIENDSIQNKPKNAYLGISYFVWYECDGGYCVPGGGTKS